LLSCVPSQDIIWWRRWHQPLMWQCSAGPHADHWFLDPWMSGPPTGQDLDRRVRYIPDSGGPLHWLCRPAPVAQAGPVSWPVLLERTSDRPQPRLGDATLGAPFTAHAATAGLVPTRRVLQRELDSRAAGAPSASLDWAASAPGGRKWCLVAGPGGSTRCQSRPGVVQVPLVGYAQARPWLSASQPGPNL